MTIEAELYAAFDPCNIPQRMTDRAGRLLPGFIERLDLLLAWSLLPEPSKTALLLRYRDHRSAAYIGRRLHLDVETVRRLLGDGLAAIERRVMADCVDLLAVSRERYSLKLLTRRRDSATIELRREVVASPAHGPGDSDAQAEGL